MYRLFAVTAPGLEPCALREIQSLGLTPLTGKSAAAPAESGEDAGGVAFEANQSDLYRVNLHLRTANRVIARLGDFYAAAFSELHKKAARLPWEQYLRPGQAVAIRATCHKSKLYHSDGVADRIASAIADRLGKPPRVVKFSEDSLPLPQLIVVRVLHDHCTISLDSSGAHLHRRGYRLQTAKAPLRETLAAGMLLTAGWDPSQPLIDPFCGSGTIPIEAALIACRIAPGKNRRFAFMDWPNYDPALWSALRDQAVADEISGPTLIQASDRDEGAIRIAEANAERAGVSGSIEFSNRALSAITPPRAPGWLITNPPYGVRVSPTHDLRNLYAQFGNVLRALCPGWNVGFLCSSDYLAGHARLNYTQKMPLINGGISVKFYLSRIRKN